MGPVTATAPGEDLTKVVTSIRMRFVLMSLAGVLLVSLTAEGTMKLMHKMVDEVNTHRLKAECYGEVNKMKYDMAIEGAIEKCMQLAPAYNVINLLPGAQFNTAFSSKLTSPFKNIQFSNLDNLVSLWRTKRDTGLVNVDEDDFVEFLEDVGEFKDNVLAKMGNLSCVLTELKLLTPELKVNIEEYTKDATEIEGFDLEASPLAQDPEWWQRLATGYQDCYAISESIPQSALNKNPMKKMFGRQMMFFKCADKNEKMNCALGQMKMWIDSYYAADDKDLTEFGLPEDKYEAAGLTLMVKYSGASDEEKFLSDFFWGSKW